MNTSMCVCIIFICYSVLPTKKEKEKKTLVTDKQMMNTCTISERSFVTAFQVSCSSVVQKLGLRVSQGWFNGNQQGCKRGASAPFSRLASTQIELLLHQSESMIVADDGMAVYSSLLLQQSLLSLSSFHWTE